MQDLAFRAPVVIERGEVTARDALFIPEGFIESPDRSFGARLSEEIDPTRLLMGMAHQTLQERGINVRDQMLTMVEAMGRSRDVGISNSISHGGGTKYRASFIAGLESIDFQAIAQAALAEILVVDGESEDGEVRTVDTVISEARVFLEKRDGS